MYGGGGPTRSYGFDSKPIEKSSKEGDRHRSIMIVEPSKGSSAGGSVLQGLDMSGVGLCHLTPSLFNVTVITKLYLNKNNLVSIPGEIGRLKSLISLDLSNNKLKSLPPEIGNLKRLEELLLYHNMLSTLPCDVGRLYALQNLGLMGNPLIEPLQSIAREGTEAVLQHLLNSTPARAPPPERQWIKSSHPTSGPVEPQNVFTVMSYNILSDKYATRQAFGYCPPWSLNWQYRKENLMKEILSSDCDLIALQEVETIEFFTTFQTELRNHGYYGIFKPKSRVRNFSDEDRRSVDGCAIFFRISKFHLVQEHLVEFEQSAIRHASGSSDMFNRVMTKDNIALFALLEHTKLGRLLFVNVHLAWEPHLKDVKLIQSILLVNEIKTYLQKMGGSIPVIIAGDFNSLPDSGVFEFFTSGKISRDHSDLHQREYKTFLDSIDLAHGFRFSSAYKNEFTYTNYTLNFSGVIDYIFFSSGLLDCPNVLEPVNLEYLRSFDGCPNTNFPSDHLSLASTFVFK